ncbi:hypothetical protein CYMTET_26295, partial [Cymbomonas tetramitiformis]
ELLEKQIEQQKAMILKMKSSKVHCPLPVPRDLIGRKYLGLYCAPDSEGSGGITIGGAPLTSPAKASSSTLSPAAATFVMPPAQCTTDPSEVVSPSAQLPASPWQGVQVVQEPHVLPGADIGVTEMDVAARAAAKEAEATALRQRYMQLLAKQGGKRSAPATPGSATPGSSKKARFKLDNRPGVNPAVPSSREEPVVQVEAEQEQANAGEMMQEENDLAPNTSLPEDGANAPQCEVDTDEMNIAI